MKRAGSIFPKLPLDQVKRLLADSDLPTADLTAEGLVHFLGYGSDERLNGVVGLEIYDDVALLRSLAVAPDKRGRGYGEALVSAAEHHALASGVSRIYLLTSTAQSFFERLGYALISRDTAPEAIRRTREFAELCPAGSVFMFKFLSADPLL